MKRLSNDKYYAKLCLLAAIACFVIAPVEMYYGQKVEYSDSTDPDICFDSYGFYFCDAD